MVAGEARERRRPRGGLRHRAVQATRGAQGASAPTQGQLRQEHRQSWQSKRLTLVCHLTKTAPTNYQTIRVEDEHAGQEEQKAEWPIQVLHERRRQQEGLAEHRGAQRLGP